MRTLVIHGRQPGLGRAELESLYGADCLRPVGSIATIIDKEPPDINFMRLGGMVKFAKVLTTLDTTNWNKIEAFLLDATPRHFSSLPEGKLKIGLSVYGINTNTRNMHATSLKLKKIAKSSGRSVRIIPNKELALNSASVLYNKLTQKLGWELLFVRDGNKTIVAQSIAVQDIDAYRRRDQERPFRDSRVGMLPPKLAQIIINLANPPRGRIVLDPFCGTGVVLQEALLMNYPVYGSDIDPRMIDYSRKNLDWLVNKYRFPACYDPSSACQPMDERRYELKLADSLKHSWNIELNTVACETYLGRALSSMPDRQTLQKIISDVDTIHSKFLKNMAAQTKPGFRMCIAIPAWKVQNGFLQLPTLDNLNDLGYNRIKFTHASHEELIYHRPGQIVGRELVVLERK